MVILASPAASSIRPPPPPSIVTFTFAPRGHEGADGEVEGVGTDDGEDEAHAPHRVFHRGPGREKACYRRKGDGGGHRPRQKGSDLQPDGEGGTLRRRRHPGQAGEIRVLGRDRGRRKERVHEVRARAQVANPAREKEDDRKRAAASGPVSLPSGGLPLRAHGAAIPRIAATTFRGVTPARTHSRGRDAAIKDLSYRSR